MLFLVLRRLRLVIGAERRDLLFPTEESMNYLWRNGR
jgi:hypothetical protein